MSYKYHNDGETPDHVDSSQSNADYPHVGIPITKADATSVKNTRAPKSGPEVQGKYLEMNKNSDGHITMSSENYTRESTPDDYLNATKDTPANLPQKSKSKP